MAALGREHRHLQPLVEMGNKLQRYEQELAETRELADSDDPEMAQEAKAEVARLEKSIAALLEQIKPALVPHDPLDDRPAIVEIRGGTGGDEAAIFAADLFRMYTRFAEGRRWRIEMISQSDGTACSAFQSPRARAAFILLQRQSPCFPRRRRSI